MSVLLKKEDREYINQLCGDSKYSWVVLPYIPVKCDKSQWGSEARNGYSYRINLNGVVCPSCLRHIDSTQIRHKMDEKDNWVNACCYCEPTWGIAPVS